MTTDIQAPETTSDDLAPLLATMRRGDPASCRDFIAHFRNPLYHYLFWLSGDADTATQLFQDTMMAAYRNLGRLRKARSPRVWIFRQATQRYFDRSHRQWQQRRSSWDNILRSGLDQKRDDRWSHWDDATHDPDADAPDYMPNIIDALKHLPDRDRAAILLVALAGIPAHDLADCLQRSRRAAQRALLNAFEKLAAPIPATTTTDTTDAPKGTRLRIRRQLAGFLSHKRQKKLQASINDNEAAQAIQAEEQVAWRVIQALPPMPPPTSLVEDTEAHLHAGQAAQEVRIATWGFRFMQVTVPIFILIFIAIILLPAISRSREAARRAAAAENLRVVGQALLDYSQQSSGKHLPPAVDLRGLWVPDLKRLYPRYIKDPAALVRPSLDDHPKRVQIMTEALNQTPPDFDTAHRLLAESYVYTGYVLLNETDLAAFNALAPRAEDFDLNARIETAQKDFIRLGRGVEMFFTPDYNDPQAVAETRATIPIMFETFDSPGFGRDPDGANVLYLDGHVDYVRFGEAFPVTPGVQELLDERR